MSRPKDTERHNPDSPPWWMGSLLNPAAMEEGPVECISSYFIANIKKMPGNGKVVNPACLKACIAIARKGLEDSFLFEEVFSQTQERMNDETPIERTPGRTHKATCIGCQVDNKKHMEDLL